ncbi:LysR family transcriptional regulator [Cryobacterium zongtaii]|uniref:LysR family transcriptional regulator n=1 Tax=Cryobacterium zongtaii TaxID=1259217 RepID=A0A2S3ZEE4_9MICO|nr:LysR substrate-binding domain-containing protein [Cryobacterium zongtaii]POH64929.1 LysR family transcriptional regulator [Cryobacterium zongtaii]
MELRQLEHFVAVAKHLSFTRAAHEVSVVQSSLSSSVSKLEHELGTPLFDRTTRTVGLTSAGWALLPVAQRILREIHAAKEAVAAVTGVLRGRLAVGTIQLLSWVDLPLSLSKFHQTHPDVEIALREAPVDELLEEVIIGELDIAYIARDYSKLPDTIAVLATWDEELVIIAPRDHPLARQGQIFLSDLGEEPFVDFQAGSGLQKVVEHLCEQAHLKRHITLSVTQLDLLISLVRSGLGIAIIPAPVARGTDLASIRIAGPVPHRKLALVSRTPQPSNPAAVALLRDVHGLTLG